MSSQSAFDARQANLNALFFEIFMDDFGTPIVLEAFVDDGLNDVWAKGPRM